MNAKTLARQAGPWLHSAVGDASEMVDALRHLEDKGTLTVRVIRGGKAGTEPKFFDEIAAALQFAPEFGENWDALLDCLSDTHWLNVKALVACILDGAYLLQEASPDQRSHCREVFEEAARRLNKAGRSFHAIWQTTAQDAADLKANWPDLVPL